MIRRRLTPLQALQRLESLCSRSEQCESELYTKLSRWGISSAMAEKIMERLRAGRYVDDVRFAHAFVRDKYLFQRWGRIKISAALRLKRIESDTISAAIDEEIDESTYHANLMALIRAKVRQLEQPRSYDNRTRLLRFAAGRGYEPAIIINTLNDNATWEETVC